MSQKRFLSNDEEDKYTMVLIIVILIVVILIILVYAVKHIHVKHEERD